MNIRYIRGLLSFAAIIWVFTGVHVHAATIVPFDGKNYSVDVVELAAQFNLPLLQSQVWYGDSDAALYFADQVDGSLGFFAENSDGGPRFLFSGDSDFTSYAHVPEISLPAELSGGCASCDHVYAVATVVPLPTAAWLFVSALGGLVVAKRRQARSAAYPR